MVFTKRKNSTSFHRSGPRYVCHRRISNLLKRCVCLASLGVLAACACLAQTSNPPVITGVTAVSVTTTGAKITWATDQASNSQVSYGTTTAYGSLTTLDTTLVTSHSESLSGLTPGTLYHYQVLSANSSGQQSASGDFTFATASSSPTVVTFDDISPPNRVLSGQYPTGLINWGTGSNWYLSGPWGLFTTQSISFNSSSQTSAGFTFISSSRLLSLQAYNGGTTSTTVTISCTGQPTVTTAVAAGTVATISTGWSAACLGVTLGNTNTWNTNFDNLTVDTPPSPGGPTITNVAAGSITSSGATITWTTNVTANSQVDYGTTTSYGSQTPLDTSLVTSHSEAVSGLTAGTPYHYRVHSTDGAGNAAVSGDFTFTTSGAGSLTLLSVSVSPASVNGGTSSTGTATLSGAAPSGGTSVALSSNNGAATVPGSVKVAAKATTATFTITTSAVNAVTSVTITGIYNGGTPQTATLTINNPVISNVAAGSITTSGATITWTTNVAANSRVEYGTTTSYGSQTTLNSSLVTSHSVALSALTAGTLYHYRVHSTDGAGNAAVSGDFTFTTAGAGPVTLLSVSVNPNSVNGGTSSVGTVTLSGAAPSGASVALSSNNAAATVPAGVPVATNATTATFTITTSPVSAVTMATITGTYNGGTPQSATLTINNPTITNVASGSITSTGATITWTTNVTANSQVEYGTTTSYGSQTTLNSSLLTSHSVALSALTAGTLYHYRVHSTDGAGNAAVSGDFTFTTLGTSTMTITFDDISPANRVLSGQYPTGIINWGTGTSWYLSGPWAQFTTQSVSFDTSSQTSASFSFLSTYRLLSLQADNGGSGSTTVTISCTGQATVTKVVPAATVLTIATGWTAACATVTITSTKGWNTNYDNLVIDNPSVQSGPAITNVAAGSITTSGATITWTTNETANSQVEYGTTTSYGNLTTLDTSLVTSHSEPVSGLTQNTLYHYRVHSTDSANNASVSGDFTFTTAAPVNITNVAAGSITTSGATITWTTDVAANSQVEYGTTPAYGNLTVLDAAMVTAHSEALAGLNSGTQYHYRVRSTGGTGYLAKSGDFTLTTTGADGTPPTAAITTPTNGATVAGTIVAIAWATDNVGVTGVQFQLDGASLGPVIAAKPWQIAWNSLNTSNGSHFLSATASDAAGNLTTVTISVQVSNSAGQPGPAISNVNAVNITANSAQIVWASDEAASSQVGFGTTTSYGSATTVNSTLSVSHSAQLSGLSANTIYHFQMVSTDGAGKTGTSTDYTFVTSGTASGTIDSHSLVFDSNARLLPWVSPQSDAYNQILSLDTSFLENGVPTDSATGLKLYYVNPYLYANSLQGSTWYFNPAGLFAMFADSALAYYPYSQDSAITTLTQSVLDYDLANGLTPANASWASVPYASSDNGSPTYSGGTGSNGEGDGSGVIEPDKLGELGYGLLRMYEFSGKTTYLNEAIQCADMLATHVRTGTSTSSPWPFRVNATTLAIVEDYSADTVGPIRLFDELMRLNLGNVSNYQSARQTAWTWLMTYPMVNNAWSNYFEDVPIQPNLLNTDQYTALETARYLLLHPEFDPDWQTHVAGILQWVESVFAQPQYGAFAVGEQVSYDYVMSSHTSRYASVQALWYEKTGDLTALEKAYRAFNWASYLTRSSGVTITGLYSPSNPESWFSDSYGDFIRHFMAGMGAVPDWSPPQENHLLRSSSVVQSVSYLTGEVDYQTFDASSTDVLHINFVPAQVTANGVALPQRTDLSQPGWTFDPSDGVLRIYHTNSTSIAVVNTSP